MTTPDPKTRILAWRDEIATEIATAEKALPPLIATHETAVAAVAALTVEHRELWVLLRPLHAPTDDVFGNARRIETPLKFRAEALTQELEKAKTRQAQANNALELARRQIAELRRASAQIDQIVPPAEESEQQEVT